MQIQSNQPFPYPRQSAIFPLLFLFYMLGAAAIAVPIILHLPGNPEERVNFSTNMFLTATLFE